MRLEQVQRFILTKKIFWGYGHFNMNPVKYFYACQLNKKEYAIIRQMHNYYDHWIGCISFNIIFWQ